MNQQKQQGDETHPSPKMLEMLRCPEEGSSLTLVDQATIDQINSLIESKSLCCRVGESIQDKLESALSNESNTWIYPVRDGIVCLLKDEAINPNALSPNA